MGSEHEFLASIERLRAAEEAGTAPPPVRYYHWTWRFLLQLLAEWVVVLVSGVIAQVRIYQGLTEGRIYQGLSEQGERTVWVCFYDRENRWLGGFNQGFGCPPFC